MHKGTTSIVLPLQCLPPKSPNQTETRDPSHCLGVQIVRVLLVLLPWQHYFAMHVLGTCYMNMHMNNTVFMNVHVWPYKSLINQHVASSPLFVCEEDFQLSAKVTSVDLVKQSPMFLGVNKNIINIISQFSNVKLPSEPQIISIKKINSDVRNQNIYIKS